MLVLNLCAIKICQAQLMGRTSSTSDPDIRVTLIPVADPRQPDLKHQFAIRTVNQCKVPQIEWGLQTIPHGVMTGVSYQSKDCHVYNFQKLTIKHRLGLHGSTAIIAGTEQFINWNNAALDLQIINIEGRLSLKKWSFGLSHSRLREQILNSFGGPLGEVRPGSYRNNLSTLSLTQALHNSFYWKGSLSVGENYGQRINIFKVESGACINRILKFSATAEYNQIQLKSKQDFSFVFFVITADFHVTRNLTAGVVSVYNQLAGFSATIGKIKLQQKHFCVSVEYREVRNNQYERLVVESPFFASSLLARIDVGF